MLGERDRELLAAAVDGGLNASGRAVLKRLLRESEEARVLFARLKADSQRLRALPVVAAPADLAGTILQRIADQGMTPTPLPPTRSRPRFGWSQPAAWAGISAAATILLTVGVMSYLYFAASRDYLDRSRLVAQRSGTPDAGAVAAPRAKKDNVTKAETPGWTDPLDNDSVASTDPAPALPEKLTALPRVVESPFAAPARPAPEVFEVIKLRLPLILPLRDLDQAYPRQKLREEIGKDDIIRLDLFCKDADRGIELLQAALKSKGHSVLVDASAQDRLNRKVRSEFLLYTEALAADDVVQLLERLGAQDRKAEKKKTGEGQFDKFVLAPFVPADLERLGRLLGVPVSHLKPGIKKGPAVDIRRPLSDATGAQLAQTLGKNGPSATRVAERLTLVVLSNPASPSPHLSREVRQFLEKRGERLPGTTPLMLTVRPLGP